MPVTIPIDTPNFAGHESFPLRFGWLKKGFDALLEDPSFFGRDDAMVVLGTGKNMVRAVRHWGLATEVWRDVEGTRGKEIIPTFFGHKLLSDDGWDPYLEELGTIWWLHWRLVNNRDRATAWTWLFARPKGNVFERDALVDEIRALVEDLGFKRSSKASLKRDVSVLIRSYSRAKTNKVLMREDSLDSPFTLLGLMRPGVDGGAFELVQGAHGSLPLPVFEAAFTEYCRSRHASGARAVTLDDLMYAPLSPGRTFRLTEDGLVERIMALVRTAPSVYSFDETAGLRQVVVHDDLPDPLDVLERHYTTHIEAVA